MLKHKISIVLLIFSLGLYANVKHLKDSLSFAINYETNDSIKVNAAIKLGDLYYNTSYKEAFLYYKYALSLSQSSEYFKGQADAFNSLAVMYYDAGVLDSALLNYQRSITLSKKLNYKQGLADTYNNLAFIYKSQLQYDTALYYHSKSIFLKKQIKDINGIAGSLNNKGKIYFEKDKINEAIKVYNLSLKYRDLANNEGGKAFTYSNIGLVYAKQNSPDSCFYYLNKALDIHKKYNNQKGIGNTLKYLGDYHMSIGQLNNAKIIYLESHEIAKKQNNLIKVKNVLYAMIDLYQVMSDHKSIVAVLLELKEVEQNIKKTDLQKLQMKIYLEKVHSEEKTKMALENKAKEFILLVTGSTSLFLIILVALLIYANHLKKNKNLIISEQNKLLAEKNKNITDSIEYAQKIQEAILPPSKILADVFKDYFVLFKPKDKVSGDFYWAHSTKDHVFFAVADCTGHGVPGALMSMMGYGGLNKAVQDDAIVSPSKILNRLNYFVRKSLHNDQKGNKIKDGMDISLCVYDLKKQLLLYSGALMSLYIIRNSALIEYKSDKMPIGHSLEKTKSFSETKIQLEDGDQIYLFSDGYVDQFGGEFGKKLKYRRFRSLIIKSAQLSAPEKKRFLEDSFAKWRKDHEQIDDVCIMGIKV